MGKAARQESVPGLLPSGNDQYEVLLFGSILEGILQAHHSLVQMEKKH